MPAPRTSWRREAGEREAEGHPRPGRSALARSPPALALRSGPQHFHGDTAGSCAPHRSPPRQQRMPQPLPGGKASTVPRGSAAAHSPPATARSELRTEARLVPGEVGGRRRGRGGLETRWRLGDAGFPDEAAGPQAGWRLRRPRRSAAPRSPDAFHLASAATEAARHPSSARHCTTQGAGEGAPDPPQPGPPPPRAARPRPARPQAALPRRVKKAALGRSSAAHLDVAGQRRGGCREPQQQQDEEPARGRGGRAPGGRHPSGSLSRSA